MERVRAVILAGGEGSRLSVLTAKRTKPAVPFGGKYRIIDFPLSNCVNSGIFDVMILAQYRPQSLIEHIGAGGPWDLNRDFTGGVRILTPYKARGSSEWYQGTADAVQQNFLFIKSGPPDLLLILSGDHIYRMNYAEMVQYHRQMQADLTMAVIHVPIEEASRFGVLKVDPDMRVVDFVEKPRQPPSNLANMGVYLFNFNVLDHELWEDRNRAESSHDFGKDILPGLIRSGKRVFAYPFKDYWVDVGTVNSYWQAHMDLLKDPPSMDLNDRSWVIHTRTEERPPVRIARGVQVIDSLIADGCVLAPGAIIERSVLGPGVSVGPGAMISESVLLTNSIIEGGAKVERTILDKKGKIGAGAHVGMVDIGNEDEFCMIGKHSIVPPEMRIGRGALVGPDVIPDDYPGFIIRGDQFIETKRLPYEV